MVDFTKRKGVAQMTIKTELRILDTTQRTIKTIADFTARVEVLREAEAKAERAGDIEAAMTAFKQRVAIILAGPGASQATAWA